VITIGEAVKTLNALDTPDAVAAFLANQNIKGVTHDPCQCPVARYLWVVTHQTYWVSGVIAQRVTKFDEEANPVKFDAIIHDLSQAVTDFVGTFDKMGYSNLIDRVIL